MGERTSHPPGAFSWADLTTSDAAGAKAFYTALLGWDYDDRPVGDGQVYSMAMRDGKEVAALSQASDQPPHWNCYVTVSSADEAAAKAKDAGANVVAEPFDVMDAGRMAVISDPTGAFLSLWEPRENIGAQLVNTPGALTWSDLITPDADAATAFYGALFGWEFEEMPQGEGYRVIKNGDRTNGGVFPRTDIPPNWMPYFGHEDVDRAVEEVPGLGGRVLNGPVRMPQGSIATFMDAQGAASSLWSGRYDD